jgi:NAD(P)H dehydrogenase (quinone)
VSQEPSGPALRRRTRPPPAAGRRTRGPDARCRTYELCGNQAWTYADLAAAFSEVLGRDVVYRPVSSAEHQEILTGAGVPEQMATMIVAVDAGIGEGAFAYQNGDLARLLGRPTTGLIDGLRPLV